MLRNVAAIAVISWARRGFCALQCALGRNRAQAIVIRAPPSRYSIVTDLSRLPRLS